MKRGGGGSRSSYSSSYSSYSGSYGGSYGGGGGGLYIASPICDYLRTTSNPPTKCNNPEFGLAGVISMLCCLCCCYICGDKKMDRNKANMTPNERAAMLAT